ncbi:MAG: hypothetical protein IT174_07000 [Acidobacteria bacterium]|nr:hypothetical protein [Acidobacteriota bacterium]
MFDESLQPVRNDIILHLVESHAQTFKQLVNFYEVRGKGGGQKFQVFFPSGDELAHGDVMFVGTESDYVIGIVKIRNHSLTPTVRQSHGSEAQGISEKSVLYAVRALDA